MMLNVNLIKFKTKAT